jgi:hypothetical protein
MLHLYLVCQILLITPEAGFLLWSRGQRLGLSFGLLANAWVLVLVFWPKLGFMFGAVGYF